MVLPTVPGTAPVRASLTLLRSCVASQGVPGCGGTWENDVYIHPDDLNREWVGTQPRPEGQTRTSRAQVPKVARVKDSRVAGGGHRGEAAGGAVTDSAEGHLWHRYCVGGWVLGGAHRAVMGEARTRWREMRGSLYGGHTA